MSQTTILHIIPTAQNGGTEKDCFYYVKNDSVNKHIVLLIGDEGPMVVEWLKCGAEILHRPILNEHLLNFKNKLKNLLNEIQFHSVLYWSTIHLPLVLCAIPSHCKIAVHIGNPSMPNIQVKLKNRILGLLFPVKCEVKLFCCSKHVQLTVFRDSYLNKFQSAVSHNPVALRETNPYSIRELTNSSKVKIGMTARLDPIKDHKTVISAFCRIIKEFPNAELCLLGDGLLRTELENYVKELNLTESVKFYGNVNNVYDYLQDLDLFVYATTPKEGLGNAVTEALANGLPSVLSDMPMIREIVGNKESALLVENDSKKFAISILELIKKTELRKKLSENAFQRAKEHFSAIRYVNDRKAFLEKK